MRRTRAGIHARKVLIAVAFFVATLAPVRIFGGTKEKPPQGMGKYFMVLREPGVQSLDKRHTSTPKHVVVPDVPGLGGMVLSRDGSSILIYLPKGKAKQLRNDENVAYLQRVWMGEPFDEWDEFEEDESSSAGRRITTNLETNLEWKADPFSYDGSGNIKKIGRADGGQDQYTYDAAGRITQSVVNGSIETYRYDSFGNLLEKTITGKEPVVIPVDPGSNRILNETYDVAGNVLTNRKSTNGASQYNYDSVGMLAETDAATGNPVRMLYTASDERIGTMQGSGGSADSARWTIRDFNGRVVREFENRYEWLWRGDYVYADGRLVGGEREAYYGGRRHFHTDHLGSVRLTSLEDRLQLGRHDYFPFGNEQTLMSQEFVSYSQRPEAMKFTSHERDFMGSYEAENTDALDYMHARFYNPTLGRFLSVDPAMDLERNMIEPQRWNRYAYVTNNPLKYDDPNGRERRIMVLSFHTPREMRLDALLQGTISFSEGWTGESYDSGYSIDARHSLGGPAMLRALQDLDNSGTDILVMNTHGGSPLQTDTGGGPDGSKAFNINPSDIAARLGSNRPQAIVLAGCATMDSAQAVANATGTIVFAINHGALTKASENSRAGAVLANVYAATGNAQFAVTVANRMLSRTCFPNGGSCTDPQFEYVKPKK
jgi:RHS repeat-associated protein